jgi:hypothetical protein
MIYGQLKNARQSDKLLSFKDFKRIGECDVKPFWSNCQVYIVKVNETNIYYRVVPLIDEFLL